MYRNISQLELNIEGQLHCYNCPNGVPIEHTKEALFQFMSYVAKVEEQQKIALAQRQAEEDLKKQETLPITDEIKNEVADGQPTIGSET